VFVRKKVLTKHHALHFRLPYGFHGNALTSIILYTALMECLSKYAIRNNPMPDSVVSYLNHTRSDRINVCFMSAAESYENTTGAS